MGNNYTVQLFLWVPQKAGKKKKKKPKSPATNLLPVAAEKYYSEILVKLGQIVK